MPGSESLAPDLVLPRTADSPRLLLIDGHSLAYRAFFALPVENFSTTTGQPTNAVYGFTSMLINVLRDEQPTHVAVAFDVSRQTFRSRGVRRVQGQPLHVARRVRGPGVADQGGSRRAAGAVRSRRRASRPTTSSRTLATQAVAAGFDVLICSGDRDSLQLVSDHITLLYPRRGVSDLARMTPGTVEDEVPACRPRHYPELAAIVSQERPDDLPGVPRSQLEDSRRSG